MAGDITLAFSAGSAAGPLIALAAVALLIAGMATFSVLWFRFTVLGERPGAAFVLPVRRRYWAFAGKVAAAYAMSFLPLWLVIAIAWLDANFALVADDRAAGAGAIFDSVLWYLSLAAILAGALALLRFQPALAAAALEQPGLTLLRSWELMRGYTLGAAGALFFCLLPFAAVLAFFELVAPGAETPVLLFVVTPLYYIVIFLAAAVLIGFVASLYQEFVEKLQDRHEHIPHPPPELPRI